MIVGTVKEIKPQEHRVGLVPESVKALVTDGHIVLVERGAGAGIGFTDDIYIDAGAAIVDTASEIFQNADMIVKVKEPQRVEYEQLREGQILFTYLHLAPDPEQAAGLIASKCIAIAYETVTDATGRSLPLLTPMSEVAGKLSTQIAAHYLMKHNGGMGKLIGGTSSVAPARVLILGGGVAGFSAAQIAVGMGGDVAILERSPERMKQLEAHFGTHASVMLSEQETIDEQIRLADVVIGAVLLHGAAAPRLIRRDQLKTMKRGAVLVDIAIDQGGCFETSHITTHNDPVFEVDGVLHYCVANMPGAVPQTSALALNHAVLPYARRLAGQGWRAAMKDDVNFRNGLNVVQGHITHTAVAKALNLPFVDPKTLI
jgi:alanine dehydrogenase